ncbi:hypothetical protein G210_5835 [Candida maltosa Xu316]|uniref:CID domain-containing protein n=1 Tax=Candida maltosa (strain Xu316) TaxID=1245528 RepID=M3HPL3_CANMX|nr:hypothetical protein G210_5835 [Candida maltosa Xu316]
MDSFDTANQLSQMLRGLTPQLQHLQKTVYFALKNSDKEDYLLSTILDVIKDKQLDTNVKSNIFQFMELLIHDSFNQSRYNLSYVQGLKENLPSIVSQVTVNKSNLHNTYFSLCNISKCFKVDCKEYVENFHSNLLSPNDLESIDKNEDFVESELTDDEPLILSWKILLQRKRQSQYDRAKLLKHTEAVDEIVDEEQIFTIRDKSNPKAPNLLSKRSILARMEDDREAHKRSKENLWMVNRDQAKGNFVTEDEFIEHYWNRFQPLNEEENKEFLTSLQDLNESVKYSYKDKY